MRHTVCKVSAESLKIKLLRSKLSALTLHTVFAFSNSFYFAHNVFYGEKKCLIDKI